VGIRLYLLSWLDSGGARLILADDADYDDDVCRSERLTLPLTVQWDLGNAYLHSGERVLTRTEEVRSPYRSKPADSPRGAIRDSDQFDAARASVTLSGATVGTLASSNQRTTRL
jgi:hypothetical protein